MARNEKAAPPSALPSIIRYRGAFDHLAGRTPQPRIHRPDIEAAHRCLLIQKCAHFPHRRAVGGARGGAKRLIALALAGLALDFGETLAGERVA